MAQSPTLVKPVGELAISTLVDIVSNTPNNKSESKMPDETSPNLQRTLSNTLNDLTLLCETPKTESHDERPPKLSSSSKTPENDKSQMCLGIASGWKSTTIIPPATPSTLLLMKRLRPVLTELHSLLDDDMTPAKWLCVETHCVQNSPPINDYLNHIVIEGFKFYERISVSNNLVLTEHYANVKHEHSIIPVRVNHTSRTRQTSYIVSKAFFVSTLLKRFYITAQSDTATPVAQRMLPEDALNQVPNSEQASNTEITQGADISSPEVIPSVSDLQALATTEPIYNYPLLTERFVKIADISLSQTDQANALIWQLNVPDGVYDALDSTTAAVLRPFTSIATDVELTFKVNANQAQCGRYVIAHWPRRDLALQAKDNVYRQITREHAIIDVASSNDVKYHVPYENVRAWTPIHTTEAGLIRGGVFATITLTCLSPIRISEQGQQTCPISVFARFRNVRLTGMRYPVAAQSDKATITPSPTTNAALPPPAPGFFEGITNIASFVAKTATQLADPVSTISSLVHPMLGKSIEAATTFIGGINNDHPPDISAPKPLLPQATHVFSNAVGSVPLRKMRIEPTSNTPQLHDFHTSNSPRTVTEIAQIPSYYTAFEVNTSQNPGDVLAEFPVVPLDPRYTRGPNVPAAVTTTDQRAYEQLPTVSYVTLMNSDYVGPLIYEFDAVKTPAHNFSLQVGYVPFNGAPGGTTSAQLQSTKWETIDFRVNNRARFVSPFISFHLMRQYPITTTGRGDLPQNVVFSVSGPSETAGINYSANIPLRYGQSMRDPGKIVVCLANRMNMTPIVSSSIQVIVYVSAAPGFKYLVPRPLRAQPASIPNYPTETPEVLSPSGYTIDTYDNVIAAQSDDMSVQAGDEMTPPQKPTKHLSGTLTQSLELHDDILTICKRTYFYTSLTASYLALSVGSDSRAVSDSPMYATVPVVPYVFPTRYRGIGDNADPFTQVRGPVNPRDALLSCFRWFRGSINVTTILKPDNGYDRKPLAITHQPPVGLLQHFTGAQAYPYTTIAAQGYLPSWTNTPGCGYATEIVIPSVNPTMTTEIPFYNPTNYLDLQAPLNISGAPLLQNDATAFSLGQLEFFSLSNMPTGQSTPTWANENQFRLNLYTSFGDDAELFHFMGVPPVFPNAATRNITMAGGLTIPPTRQQIQIELLKAGIESNPGPAFSRFFGTASHFESNSETDDASRSAHSWWDSVKALVRLPSNITTLAHSVDVVTQKFEELKTNLALLIPDINYAQLTLAITALLNAYVNPTKLAVVTAVLSFLSLFPFILKNFVDNLLTRAVSLFRPTLAGQAENMYTTDPAIIAIFSSLLIEGMVVQDKVKKMPKADETIKGIVTQYLSNINYARTGVVCMLVYRLCNAITTIWTRLRTWCASYGSVSLLEVDQEFIDNFMIDYAYVMSELNVDVFNFSRINKDRYWTTVISAYYLQAVMVKYKTTNPHLKTACTQIIMRANSLNSRVTAPPVRYEPFVLWLFGAPGVGKTTILHDIMITLAKHLKINYPADPIYSVKATSQYMNGLNRQPIVIFDDCGATSDNIVEPTLLNNFMAMKSSARMLVDKPRLEDKDAEFTAPLVGCSSNMKYWPVENAVRDKAALDRRRDVLVKVDWSSAAVEHFQQNPGCERKASTLPPEITKDCGHQVFIVHHDKYRSGHVPDGFTPPPPDRARTYIEFEMYMKEQLTAYHTQQVDLMYARYKKSLSLAKQHSETLTDPASLKLALISIALGCEESDSDVPLETLRHSLFTLESMMPEYYRTLNPTTRTMITHLRRNEEVMGNAETAFSFLPTEGSPWYLETIANMENRNPSMTFVDSITRYMSDWTNSPLPDWVNTATYVIDLNLTSACTGCGSQVGELDVSNGVKALCPQSTADNQHWWCNDCYHSAHSHNMLNCPVCRHPTMAIVTRDHQKIAAYKKAWCLLRLGTLLVARLAVRVFHGAVMLTILSAIIASISSLCITMYVFFDLLATINTTTTDTNRYIQRFGVEPESYLGRDENGRPMYTHEGRVHIFEGDVFQPIVGQNDPLPYRLVPDVPIDRLPKCCHAPVTDISNTTIVAVEGEDIACPSQPRNVLNVMRCTELLASWPFAYCSTPDEMPPGLNETEIAEHMSSPTTIFNTNSCYLKIHFDEVNRQVIMNHKDMWEADPDTIPTPYRVARIEQAAKSKISEFCEYQRDLIRRIRQRVVPLFAKIMLFVTDYLYTIIGFLACLFGLYYGYGLIWSEQDGYVPDIDAQSSTEARSQVLQRRQNNTREIRRVQPIQGNSDQMMSPIVESVLKNYEKAAVTLNHYSTRTDALGIFGSTILLPRHAYRQILHFEDGCETSIVGERGRGSVLLSKLPCTDYPDKELVAITLPSSFSFRNLTKTFNRSTEHSQRLPEKVWVASPAKKKRAYVPITGTTENCPVLAECQVDTRVFTYENPIPLTFRVKGYQSPGLCMSIAICEKGQVLGIHIGGVAHTDEGYLVPVYSDEFSIKAQSLGSMTFLESVEDAPFHTRKSKIRPSAIAPIMHSSITEPCIQSRNDPRLEVPSDPLIEGCKTIGAPTNPPDPVLLSIVSEAVFDCVVKKFPAPVLSPHLSVDVAIMPMLDNVASMDRNTSVGYPLSNRFVKKADVYDVIDGRVVWKAPEVKRSFEADYEKRMQRENVNTIFVAHLKDERRTPEKNRRPGGTRVFHIAPMEVMISARRALIPFIDACVYDPVRACHAVTLNPDSVQWTKMMNKMTSKGRNFIQLDYSKFSDSMPHEFVDRFFELVRRYYKMHGVMSQSLENVLHTLHYDITRSKVLVYNDIFQISNGVLQGHPLTAVLNSFVNILEQVYVYSRITGDSPYHFFEDCALMVMGDDVAISTNDTIIQTYNAQSIAYEFNLLNVKVTDPFDKFLPIELMPKSYPPKQFVLLSRSIALHPTRQALLAPIKLQSIVDVPLWVRGTANVENTNEVVQASLLLAFTHGPAFYCMWTTYLEAVYDASKIEYTFPSWNALDYMLYKDVAPRDHPIDSPCSCPFNCISHLYNLLKQQTTDADPMRSGVATVALANLETKLMDGEFFISKLPCAVLSAAELDEINKIRHYSINSSRVEIG
nr:MAG: polyprotein [Iflaviridae sp.]